MEETEEWIHSSAARRRPLAPPRHRLSEIDCWLGRRGLCQSARGGMVRPSVGIMEKA